MNSITALLRPVLNPKRVVRSLRALPRYLRDYRNYRKLLGPQAQGPLELRPILDDWTIATDFDAHYVYLGAWAFRLIAQHQPSDHLDVGSQIGWVTCLAAIVPVTFVDIRPFKGAVPNLNSVKGSILEIPYSDKSRSSVSCLHVAEHIGLGRYGDPLNPTGTEEAIRELSRILKADGRLYFGLPVGRPRTCFNAHRIHDPLLIVDAFAKCGLELLEFAAVDDARRFRPDTKPSDVRDAAYACGMYQFTRR